MGARKSIVIGCIAVIAILGVATVVALAKTSARDSAYKAALPSPFVKERDKPALREIEHDQRESARTDSGDTAAEGAVAVVTPRAGGAGSEKSAAQLDAEDRYIDRLAGQFEGRNPEGRSPDGSVARTEQTTGSSGIPVPVGGIAVEMQQRASAPAATADGQQPSAVAGQDAPAQQQQVPYRDDFFPYYGAFPALPVNGGVNLGSTVNGNGVATQAGTNGVVQAQPPVRETSQNGAAVSAPAPGAVAAPNQPQQQNIPQPALPQQNVPQQNVPQQNAPQQNGAQQPNAPQAVPYQTAPAPQPVPFQTQPPPAAQRGY